VNPALCICQETRVHFLRTNGASGKLQADACSNYDILQPVSTRTGGVSKQFCTMFAAKMNNDQKLVRAHGFLSKRWRVKLNLKQVGILN